MEDPSFDVVWEADASTIDEETSTIFSVAVAKVKVELDVEDTSTLEVCDKVSL